MAYDSTDIVCYLTLYKGPFPMIVWISSVICVYGPMPHNNMDIICYLCIRTYDNMDIVCYLCIWVYIT